jgi:hypothetical protein
VVAVALNMVQALQITKVASLELEAEAQVVEVSILALEHLLDQGLLILVAGAVVVVNRLLPQGLAAPALSFSSGLSHYRPQTPLHLQEHG